jgi:hypothetical protein
MLTRRTFLGMWPAVSLLCVPHATQGGSNAKPWYESMRRCGQLNLNERDPVTLDVTKWIDYWASLKLNALLLNGGGIVAFYPTAIPHHHRSEFLGTRDLFGELVAAAKGKEMRVVSRMDCNYAYEDALRAHPEWFERNLDGSPRPHGESPWLFKTCMFSSYFTQQMPAIYREINARYPVDGFFTNGWPSTGRVERVLLRILPPGVPHDWRHATRRNQRDGSVVSPLLRRLHDSRRRCLDRVAARRDRKRTRIGLCGKSRWRDSDREESRASGDCRGLVQCRSPGTFGRHANLGLRAAGARCPGGHARPADH